MKKKLLSFIIASMLLLVSGFTLAGCNEDPGEPTTPVHTHEYAGELYYKVNNNKAYSFKKCECGEISEETEITNAIIVTPSTIQMALDGKVVLRSDKYCVAEKEAGESYVSLDNKVMVLDSGEYNQAIEFRPTKESNTKVYGHNDYVASNTEVAYNDMLSEKSYIYLREINNLTIAGTENAKIKQLVSIYAATSDKIIQKRPDFYDGIRGNNASNGVGFNLKYRIDNLKFTRLNFEGSNGRIWIKSDGVLSLLKNITIENCEFTTQTVNSTTETINNASIHLFGYKDKVYLKQQTLQNVNIKNNKISGHTIGVYMRVVEGVTITNNDISKSYHNLIGVYDSTGVFTISNNNLSDSFGTKPTRERAIRFNNMTNSTITIENNNFTNCYEDRTESQEGYQVCKAGNLSESTYSVSNNNYEGILLESISGSEEEFIIYKP